MKSRNPLLSNDLSAATARRVQLEEAMEELVPLRHQYGPDWL